MVNGVDDIVERRTFDGVALDIHGVVADRRRGSGAMLRMRGMMMMVVGRADGCGVAVRDDRVGRGDAEGIVESGERAAPTAGPSAAPGAAG